MGPKRLFNCSKQRAHERYCFYLTKKKKKKGEKTIKKKKKQQQHINDCSLGIGSAEVVVAASSITLAVVTASSITFSVIASEG